MFFIIFAFLSVLLNGIKCNNNFSVLYINKTETGFISKSIELLCPILKKEFNVNIIIWNFDNITISLPINQTLSDVTTRIRGRINGSLFIEKLEYNDSKIYKCQGYSSILLYEINIALMVKGPPLKFLNFSYGTESDSRLILFWNINNTNANTVHNYNITLCKGIISNQCKTVTISHPQYSYVFEELDPFSEYQASIIAFNDVGSNDRVDLRAKTGSGIPVANLTVNITKINGRNVTMRIECKECFKKEKMRGDFKYFLISYKDQRGPEDIKWPSKSPLIEETISNLLPYNNYTFLISASNGVHEGPKYSAYCLTKMDLPKFQMNLRATYSNATMIKIKWKINKFEHITGYTLKISDQSILVKEVTVRNNKYQYKFTGLKPRNLYIISLAATNDMGLGKFENITFRTDRSEPLSPKINYVKIINTFIRIAWRNVLPLNETSTSKYKICWIPIHLNFEKKCFETDSSGHGDIKCMCQINSTFHSVDIPKHYVNLNFSQIKFWVTLSVSSDLCDSCPFLEANSDDYILDLEVSQTDVGKSYGSSSSYTIIILLTVGCLIFFVGFLAVSCFCGNRNFKQLFLPNRPTGHYSRTPGEYIEVFPRPVSQPKMLSLEKTPYPPILVKDLVDHIMNYRCDDGAGFQTEFEAIELMDTSKWSITYPNLKDNKIKNRYTNIFPYDHSRVILQYPPHGKSDYINASFIDGYNRRNAYIATQGPLTETIADFWQMIYEQNSEIIIMISNFEERGRRKCEMYWVPNKVVCYGNISVRQLYHKKMAFYTERRFGIKNTRIKRNANKERTIYHYQYTDWRDFDVPPSSLPVLVFVKAAIRHWSTNSGPMVVHCSAGVGRTGTFICIESQIRQMEMEHRINVRGFLEHIRQQRMKLVQTESQYTFIHDALYEYYLCPDHEIHKDIYPHYILQLFNNDVHGFSKLEQQFQMCTQFQPTNYEYIECKRSYNLSKNRSTILPIESRRINISCEPGIEGSNYINASAIQGYWEMKEFIITQHPLEETEPDFWKMVWDENCQIIILLSSENLPQFWPAFENEFRSYRWSRVNHCNSEDNGNISQHGFLLSSPREDYALDCTMHRLKRWPNDVSDTADLLRLLFKVNSEKDHAPIMVIDDFGGSKAGIFVALSSLVNQLRNDEVVDVYFVMKMIHMERPHTFQSSDDLKFVYDVMESLIRDLALYPFFSEPAPSFVPNGVCHPPSAPNPATLHNSSFISQYATLNTLRSKSSTSTSRRRPSSAESEPFCVSNQSPPVKSRVPHNRISWNPGETHYSSITDSFVDWSTFVSNGGHHNNNNGPVSVQITSNPIIEVEMPGNGPDDVLFSQGLDQDSSTLTSEV